MSIPVLDSASFWALDPACRRAVRDYVDPDGERTALDMPAIYRNRWTLAQALVGAERVLDATNPASFEFLSPAQKKVLQGELFLIFYPHIPNKFWYVKYCLFNVCII